MRIKVINPNTTAGMTDKIGQAARAAAAPGTEVVTVSPKHGDYAAPIPKKYTGAFAGFAPRS